METVIILAHRLSSAILSQWNVNHAILAASLALLLHFVVYVIQGITCKPIIPVLACA